LNVQSGIILGVATFSILLILFIIKSVVSVPARYNYIVTYFGDWQYNLEPGLNFVYPWFNIFDTPVAYCVAEHSVDIFPDSDDPKDMIEFKDSSTWIKLSVRMKVINPKLAFTAVEDVYTEITEIFKKYFRDYAEDRDFLNFVDKHKKENKFDLEFLFSDSDILNYIEREWGVKIIAMRLEDIIPSEEDRKAREEVFNERRKTDIVKEQNLQTIAKAKAEAKRISLIAKAKKNAQKEEGLGLQEALDNLINTKLSPEKASQFLQSLRKWEAVQEVETGFFSDSQSAETSISKHAIAEIIAISNEISKKQ
jgi:regulator of protease activity HflC (stomatin/prohibitin superfamily)